VHVIFASDSRMWRASGVNLAHMSGKCYAQNVHTMCVMSPAYIMQMLRAPAARGAGNKGCYVWTPLYSCFSFKSCLLQG
jgi:hypothetical protein